MRRWLLIAALGACGGDDAPAIEVRPPIADAAAAAPRDRAPAERGFVGVLVAAESVDVAPRAGGVVARVHVRAGDRVAAGQLVAEMDPAPLREELRAAEAALRAQVAALRQAEVDVAEARRVLELETGAVAAGTSPRQNLEAAELALERAKAERDRARSTVAEARSRVETARSRLADANLRASFDGVVANRYKDAGATVAGGTPIVRIVGEGRLRLRFAVPPERARELAIDAPVEAIVETVDAPVPAVVRHILPAVDPASGMILVEAELSIVDEEAQGLRPGLGARVRPR